MPKIPKTMKAVAIDKFGKPDVLKVHWLLVPKLESDEVLIALHAAGVGSWDADMREGWYPGKRPRFPWVLGVDGAGTIAAKGSKVRRFKVGHRVYAYNFDNSKSGFYSEYVVVPAENVGRKPKRLDLLHAGAIACTGLTALQGIDDALNLKRRESILIHGASGGVGSLAVQFAKLRGARVLATVSKKDAISFVQRLGADMVVDGKEDIVSVARQFAPKGIDAVLALTGNGLRECLDTLRKRGRVAYPNGIEPKPRKRRGIKIIPYNAEVGVREFDQLTRAIDKASLRVPIASIYPLINASASHERIKAGHVLGKIVLRVR